MNQQHIEVLGYIEQYIDGAVENGGDDSESAYLWIDAVDLVEEAVINLNLTYDAGRRLIAEMVRDGLLVRDGGDYGMTTAGADALGYGHEYTVKA